MRFRNAFVVNSLCSPSRASLITGQYGHGNGVVNNQSPHPEGNLSLPALLRPAGYTSGSVGKWHHWNQSGKRPGFDYSASFRGQGDFFDCPFEVNDIPDREGGDGRPELVIRGEHPVVAMPVLSRRRHEIGQPVQEVKRREFDDAVGTRASTILPGSRWQSSWRG